jgi:hypothetical protein
VEKQQWDNDVKEILQLLLDKKVPLGSGSRKLSAEIERVFSSARLLLTPQRNRMTDSTIEMLELLRNWIKQDITTSKFSSSTPPGIT